MCPLYALRTVAMQFGILFIIVHVWIKMEKILFSFFHFLKDKNVEVLSMHSNVSI